MSKTTYKSVPGAVLGIIGAVFALIGAIGIAMCADIVDGVSGSSYTWAAYVFGIGGAIIAILGSILDFKNIVVGAVLMFVAIGFCLTICIIMYFSWALIVSMILLLLGGVLSFVIKRPVV